MIKRIFTLVWQLIVAIPLTAVFLLVLGLAAVSARISARCKLLSVKLAHLLVRFRFGGFWDE